jgi:hypothetical protein
MFDIMAVYEALKCSRGYEPNPKGTHVKLNPEDGQDSLISLLIHDIFGGEILKTRKKNGWHFYNRIDGLRLDFTKSVMDKPTKEIQFEDIPSTPEETSDYFEKEDYSTFFMRFIRAFEESVGLEKQQPGYTA